MDCLGDRTRLLLLLLLTAATAWATPRLNDLSVDVLLLDNGDARITEVRQMNVEDTGTECYISIGNLNGSSIENVSVTDEIGTYYKRNTPWDSGRSRQAKSGQWGLVSTDNGYELCWGLGESGERTYTVSYTVTGLLRSYSDYDGFNYMFVAENLNPPAEHARVTIRKENGEFTDDEVGMWAFRFKGVVNLVDGCIVAETEDELSSDHAMIVMLQFEKDVFHPAVQAEGTFETVKERAFEGSDYGKSLTDWLKEGFAWLLLGAIWLIGPFIMLCRYIKVWRFRRAVNSDIMWYRDLPYSGNLLRANQVLNAMCYKKKNTKSLISACVLRLVSVGALRIEPLGDGSGKSALVIGPLERVRGLADTKLLRSLHRIFTEAAGSDGILQPKELKKWMGQKKNEELLVEFMAEATSGRNIKELRKEMESCRKVVGLRQFLKDFTLANERHAVEVELWKDYLVYAELFGIAKQVRRDMQKISPDYFKMDEVFGAMCNTSELPSMINISLQGLLRALKLLNGGNSRSSGGGGSASMGGGGGYSGGGSGGGIR